MKGQTFREFNSVLKPRALRTMQVFLTAESRLKLKHCLESEEELLVEKDTVGKILFLSESKVLF